MPAKLAVGFELGKNSVLIYPAVAVPDPDFTPRRHIGRLMLGPPPLSRVFSILIR